jgi:hypothetical protein
MPPAILADLCFVTCRKARGRTFGRLIAAGAWRAGSAAETTARPVKRPIGMVFAHPADVVAAGATDGHISPSVNRRRLPS